MLQGNCLSTLIFKLCFSTFIQFIKEEKYKQLGFSQFNEIDCFFHFVHLFKFVDAIAVIIANESLNQLLLHCFSRWCQRPGFLGIKTFSSTFLFQSSLFINSEVIPPVKQVESFSYLRRYFSLDMNNKDHNYLALSNLQTMLKTSGALNSIPRTNYFYIDIRYILSTITFHLTAKDLGKTLISENL